MAKNGRSYNNFYGEFWVLSEWVRERVSEWFIYGSTTIIITIIGVWYCCVACAIHAIVIASAIVCMRNWFNPMKFNCIFINMLRFQTNGHKCFYWTSKKQSYMLSLFVFLVLFFTLNFHFTRKFTNFDKNQNHRIQLFFSLLKFMLLNRNRKKSMSFRRARIKFGIFLFSGYWTEICSNNEEGRARAIKWIQ